MLHRKKVLQTVFFYSIGMIYLCMWLSWQIIWKKVNALSVKVLRQNGKNVLSLDFFPLLSPTNQLPFSYIIDECNVISTKRRTVLSSPTLLVKFICFPTISSHAVFCSLVSLLFAKQQLTHLRQRQEEEVGKVEQAQNVCEEGELREIHSIFIFIDPKTQ